MATSAKSLKSFQGSQLWAGIDFGTTKIALVIGQRTADGVEILGVGKQPSMGIRKGMIVNIPSTVEAIKRAKETAELMAGCKIHSAVIGVAGSHIKGFNSSGVVAIKNKQVSEDDVARALDAAQAVTIPQDREILHVLPQEYAVNDEDGVRNPVGMAGVRLEAKVHIVTGTTTHTQNMVRCAEQAGLAVQGVVLECLAAGESVLTHDERELGVALVDIGGGTTDVALFYRGSLVHSSMISMGGNHITNDIAVGLRTSIQDAENVKTTSGCAMASQLLSDSTIEVPSVGGRKSKEISKSTLAKIIEPRVEEILSLVAEELQNSGFRHLLSAGVVLTGGTSLLDGICELAEYTLELPVRRGVPQGLGGLSDVVSSPVYATAVGLPLFLAGKETKPSASKTKLPKEYGRFVERMKSWLEEVF